MKSHLPLIASIFFASTSCSYPVVKTQAENIAQTQPTTQETEIIAQEINPYIKDNIAPEISVKINSAENGGSGVIIAQSDNTYLVLTNNHVLRDGEKFAIDTHDGETYQATEVEKAIASDDDLALLQFKSNKSYQTATINTAAVPKAEQTILAVGHSAETGELVTETGKIERVPDKTLKDGYSIGYTSNIVQGMSGGAILNIDGEVIGINGKSAFPIVNSGYDNEDGTKPSAEEVEQLRQLSWGLSINRLLAQVNPEIITAYNLPLPETTDDIASTQRTGWLGDLETKAKQISVRIDSSSGANGSGVIIAKEGNTYTVLTADHVLCEQDEARKCINYSYEIVAPDGKKYLNIETVKRQEGVDLAVVRFDSNEQYQVAQLANYPIAENDEVFVAGYPKLNNNSPARWLFSLGYGFNREQGLLNIADVSLSTDSSGVASSQGSLSGGYEMVYTSITYGGMSGGAVLDRKGRLIGIHGLAEGQTALNGQNSSGKQVQLGYSLGVPINTFIELAERLEIDIPLSIQNDRPTELSSEEIKAFNIDILGAEIPQANASAETWLNRGNRLLRLTRHSEAGQAFDRAIALNPEFIHLAYFGKALALFYQQKYEPALTSSELALENQPDFTPAFRVTSSTLQKLNRYDDALAAIEKEIALQENNANAYNTKGIILWRLKQFSEAEIAYQKAIEINPRSVFYSNRGLVYYDRGKSELALADYNRAIEINLNNVDAYNNRGLVYYDLGKLELALFDYNRAIEIDPNNVDAYNNRADIYRDRGESELALADYNRAIEIAPQLAQAYNNRGVFYYGQNKLELALTDYNRALEIDSDYDTAYNNRGNLYRNRGKLELALADYNRAIKINPDDLRAYSDRGLVYYSQGKLELALADYNRLIEINPDNAKAYSNRAIVYGDLKKLELALSDHNRAIAIDSNNAQAYNNRGSFYIDFGKPELALSDLNRAIEIDPNNASAYRNRGGLYTNQDKPELALSDFNRAIEIEPDNAKVYSDRGNLHASQERWDLALSDFDRTIQIDSNNSQAHYNRGLIYANQEKWDLALADFDRTIEIDPNDARAYNNRGILYKKQGKLELALADYNRALEINPQFDLADYNRQLLYKEREELDPANSSSVQTGEPDSQSAKAYYDRGNSQSDRGELELALTSYSRAIQINPNYDKAYYNRALIHAQQGQLELAIADYSRAIQINPDDADAYNNRGVLYNDLEKQELALADFERAIQVAPNNAQAYNNRGVVYRDRGDLELALADFERAIEIEPNYTQAYYNRELLYQKQEKLRR